MQGCHFQLLTALAEHILTLGSAERKDPINVTIVKTVVTPSPSLAGTAFLSTQKVSHDSATIRNVGTKIWTTAYCNRRFKTRTKDTSANGATIQQHNTFIHISY